MVLWYFTLNTLRISLQKEILKDGAMFSFRTQRRLTTACYKTGSSLSNSMVDVVIKDHMKYLCVNENVQHLDY